MRGPRKRKLGHDAPLRDTTSALAGAADAVVALAVATLFVPGDRLPLLLAVPLLALAPRWVDAIRLALRRATDNGFVPDPLAPDWRALGTWLHEAGRHADVGRRPVRVLLCALCRDDGSPRSYALDWDPARERLTVHIDGERTELPWRLRLRPRVALPVRVAESPVELIFEPGARGEVRLCAPDAAAATRSVPVALVLAALCALFDRSLGLLALVAAVVRLAATGGVGGWPLRRGGAPAKPPASLRGDRVRLWVAGLWLLRFGARDGVLGAWLADPLRLYAYGFILPLLAVRLTGTFRHRPALKADR